MRAQALSSPASLAAASLAGGLVVWILLLARDARPDGPPTVRPAGSEPTDASNGIEQLGRGLQRVEARLAALEQVLSAASPRARVTPHVDADLTAVLAALEELRGELERRVDGPAAAPRLAELKELHPEEDWVALRELIGLWNRDPQAARRATMLLDRRAVLTRYGTPSETWQGANGLNWLYTDGSDAVTGASVIEVWFNFNDGVVTELGVKQP